MDWGITLGSTYFNSLDIIIFCLSLVGGIGGAFEGFAKTFTSKVGVIAGIIVGAMFARPISELLIKQFPLNEFLGALIGYLIAFVIGYWILLWIGSFVSKLMDNLGIGAIDSLLGFIFGMIITFAVCAGIIYIISFQQLIDFSMILDKSYLYANVIKDLVPNLVSQVSK